MNLIEVYNSKFYNTDKDTVHSYISYFYNELFKSKTEATNILEIGVQNGGSILLWRDFFKKAIIDGIDIENCIQNLDNDRINHIVADAYDMNTLSKLSNLYDIMIDDGPHLLESIRFFAKNYVHLLKSDGIAIIEDIQQPYWFKVCQHFIPKGFYCEMIDLRYIKHRYDDILVMIRRH